MRASRPNEARARATAVHAAPRRVLSLGPWAAGATLTRLQTQTRRPGESTARSPGDLQTKCKRPTRNDPVEAGPLARNLPSVAKSSKPRSDLYVARPPKKVSEMTDAERRQWAETVYRAFTAAVRPNKGAGPS
jgi:hypothetical protein